MLFFTQYQAFYKKKKYKNFINDFYFLNYTVNTEFLIVNQLALNTIFNSEQLEFSGNATAIDGEDDINSDSKFISDSLAHYVHYRFFKATRPFVSSVIKRRFRRVKLVRHFLTNWSNRLKKKRNQTHIALGFIFNYSKVLFGFRLQQKKLGGRKPLFKRKAKPVVFLRLSADYLIREDAAVGSSLDDYIVPSLNDFLIKKKSFKDPFNRTPLQGFMYTSLVKVFSKRGLVFRLFKIFNSYFYLNKIKFFRFATHYYFDKLSSKAFSSSLFELNINCFNQANSIPFSKLYIRILGLFFINLGLPVINFYLVNKKGYRRLVDSIILFSCIRKPKKRFLLSKVITLLNTLIRTYSPQLFSRFLSDFQTLVELKPWQRSGQTVFIPTPITNVNRKRFSFLRIFKQSVAERIEYSQSQRLTLEFFDFIFKKGLTVSKLQHAKDLIKQARPLVKKVKFLFP